MFRGNLITRLSQQECAHKLRISKMVLFYFLSCSKKIHVVLLKIVPKIILDHEKLQIEDCYIVCTFAEVQCYM